MPAVRKILLLLSLALLAPVSAPAATPMISAGAQHTLALQSDGTVLAWGSDQYGQLGIGRAVYSAVPILGPGLTSVRAISAGSSHALAVKQDGTVWSWGQNTSGQLGDGTTAERDSPVQVTGFSNAAVVAGGMFHSVALKTDGTVWTWGDNSYGVLGTGKAISNSTSPLQAVGLSGMTAIAAGAAHSVALRQDGTVWTWGRNLYGQLGNGTTTDSGVAVQVPGLSGVVAIGAGYFHSVALKSDGTVWEWGIGIASGGNPSFNRTSPVQSAGVAGVVALGSGGYFITAVKADGSAMYWQVGQAPAVLAGASKVSRAAVAGFDTFLLENDGSVMGFGRNDNGQVGDGTTVQRNAPVAVVGLTSIAALAGGDFFSMALGADGRVWTWGSDSTGQLGRGAITSQSIPSVVQGLSGVVFVAAGQYHSLAITQDGNLWAWGYNLFGQLGDGTNTNKSAPVQVTGISNLGTVAGGGAHSLALKQDGTLWAWGYNYDGAIGIGNNNYPTTPVQVPGMTGVVAIAASYQSLAVKQDGTVWAWGRNDFGQLGLGTVTPVGSTSSTANTKPVQVSGPANIRSVNAAAFRSFAVAQDGTVWAWGGGQDGGLGNGVTVDSSVPVHLSTLASVQAISGGNEFTLAYKTDGTVWGWGNSFAGQLGGAATFITRPTPTQLSGLTPVTQLAAGGSFSEFLRGDGTIYTMGDNSVGELGDGTFAQPASPVLVVNPTASGYLDIIVGAAPVIPQSKAVPFFVISSGAIAAQSATVATTVKYNNADQGKNGSVYITAVVPAGSSLTHGLEDSYRQPLQGTAATQTIQLTPSGWQPVVNGQLIPFTSGVLGATSSALQILNNTDTSTLPGAQFCVGYGTGSASSVTSRTVATIPATTGTATITATCATAVTAIVPQAGYWWNPAEGGRGYTIEQNAATGNVFFATYLYTAGGNSLWYAAGPGQMSGNTFSGPLLAYSGGQTLTGAFKPAGAGTSPGSVSITFSDPQNASLTWPGGTIAITRYPIVPGGTNLTPPAMQPQSGYWWNPAEGGRGYTIEVQNNTAFIAAYMYDTSGNPVWYAAGPATLTGSNTFQGSWTSYTGGQTLTGTYHSPTNTTNSGNLTVQFANATSGTLTLPDGRQIPIQRFTF